jgi:transposase
MSIPLRIVVCSVEPMEARRACVEWRYEVEEKGKGSCSSWEKEMDKERMRAAKARLVAEMQAGQPWHVAAATAGLQTSQSTAYRLCQVVRERGEMALQDGRHGHPVKLRGEARTFLEAYCRKAPHTPGSVIQTLLQERFDLSVSISQINRVRAALGISSRPLNQEQGKKQK